MKDGAMMTSSNSTRIVTALFLATAFLLTGCPEGLFGLAGESEGIELPTDLSLDALSPEQKEYLRAGVKVGDGDDVDERRLDFNETYTHLTGTLILDSIDDETDTQITIRVYGRYSETSKEVLLTEANIPFKIIPNQDNMLEIKPSDFELCGPASLEDRTQWMAEGNEEEACRLILDENRNGLSNIVDMHANIDPLVSQPLVDLSPQTLQFPSGIRLGEFARQVVVIENTTNDILEIDVSLIGGDGLSIARFETAGSELGNEEYASRHLDFDEIAPYGELYVAVSFAPANAYFSTGALHVRVNNKRTFIEHASRVKIIANSDGELAPAGADYATSISPEAIEGFDGPISTFPVSELASGLAVSSSQLQGSGQSGLLSSGQWLSGRFMNSDGNQISHSFPIDQAYLVHAPVDYRLAVNLDGLEADIDLALIALDSSGAVDTESAFNHISTETATSPEAMEIFNNTESDISMLVVLGRADSNDDPPPETPGALTVDATEPIAYNLRAQISSSPLFLPPPEAPEASPVEPGAEGDFEGGNRVTLWGRGFQDGASVLFADKVATDCVWANPIEYPDYTTISCTVPGGSLDVDKNPATVVVANPSRSLGGDGQSATLPRGYYYFPPAPRIERVSPSAGTVVGGDEVLIQGAYFSVSQGLPRVQFGDHDGSDVIFVSPNLLSVKTPASDAERTVEVRAYNCLESDNFVDPQDGNCLTYSTSASGSIFTYLTPETDPNISDVSPSIGSIDGTVGDLPPVTIVGSDFLEPIRVYFGNRESVAVSYMSDTTISVDVPAVSESGAVDVKVVNGDGAQVVLEAGYTYFIPAPTINSSGITPPQSLYNESTSVVIHGTGFRAGAQVKFILGTLVYDAGSLLWLNVNQLLVGTPIVAEPGSYDVVVTNPDGQQAAFSGFLFQDPGGPAPQIKGMNPALGVYNQPTESLIWGTNFSALDELTVLAGSVSAETLESGVCCEGDTCVEPLCIAGDQYVRIRVPSVEAPETVVVRLINEDGQSATTPFVYADEVVPPPTIFSLSPQQGEAGTLVTLSGEHFDVSADSLAEGAYLQMGSEAITQFVVASSTELQFQVPDLGIEPGGVSLVTVRLTNGDGQSAEASFVAVAPEAPIVISSVTPEEGVAGTPVTIIAQNLDDPRVFMAGIEVTTFTLTDLDVPDGGSASGEQQLQFDVPVLAHVQGNVSVNIQMTNDNGASISTPFTYLGTSPAPAIVSVYPSTIDVSNPSVNYILGHHLTGETTLSLLGQTMGTVSCDELTALSAGQPIQYDPEQLDCIGLVDCQVLSHDGGSSMDTPCFDVMEQVEANFGANIDLTSGIQTMLSIEDDQGQKDTAEVTLLDSATHIPDPCAVAEVTSLSVLEPSRVQHTFAEEERMQDAASTLCGQSHLAVRRYRIDAAEETQLTVVPIGDHSHILVSGMILRSETTNVCEESTQESECFAPLNPLLTKRTITGSYELLVMGEVGASFDLVISLKDQNGDCLIPDGDDDGYTICDADCEDSDALIHPAAEETCEGLDRNCDGQVDVPTGLRSEDGATDYCSVYRVGVCTADGYSTQEFVKPAQFAEIGHPLETVENPLDEACGVGGFTHENYPWLLDNPQGQLNNESMSQALALPLSALFAGYTPSEWLLSVYMDTSNSSGEKINGITINSKGEFLISFVNANGVGGGIRQIGNDGVVTTLYHHVTGTAQKTPTGYMTTGDYYFDDFPEASVWFSTAEHTVERLALDIPGSPTTVAGTYNQPGNEDGDEANTGKLNTPRGLSWEDSVRELYIADYGNHLIRQVDNYLLTLNVSTQEGGGAELSGPTDLVAISVGGEVSSVHLYVVEDRDDGQNGRVAHARKSGFSDTFWLLSDYLPPGPSDPEGSGPLEMGAHTRLIRDPDTDTFYINYDVSGRVVSTPVNFLNLQLVAGNGGVGSLEPLPLTTRLSQLSLSTPYAIAYDAFDGFFFLQNPGVDQQIYNGSLAPVFPESQKGVAIVANQNESEFFELQLDNHTFFSARMSFRYLPDNDWIFQAFEYYPENPCRLAEDADNYLEYDYALSLYRADGTPADPNMMRTHENPYYNSLVQAGQGEALSRCGTIENFYLPEGGTYYLEVRNNGTVSLGEVNTNWVSMVLEATTSTLREGETWFCGDGIVQGAEDCDFANAATWDAATDYCSPWDCQLITVVDLGGTGNP
jgi:hypothetical protein